MKRKSSIIMLLCALTGFVLAGCSGSSDNPQPPPASTNAPAAPATPPATN